MKNPLAYLKHLVKDPINTNEEADARKAEIMPLLYGSAGLLALGVILQVVARLEFMVVFSVIGLFGAVFFAFLLSVITQAKARFTVLTCDKCNTMADIQTHEDFVKYISYVVEKDEAIYKGRDPLAPSNKNGGLYAKAYATSSAIVSVDITCPNCGEKRHLKYSATPFKCYAERRNINPPEFEFVRSKLESAVQAAVDDYNNPDKKGNIPYSFHSSKNANFEKRHTLKGANAIDAHPKYMDVRIDYHKDVEEMLEHYFVLRELNGGLTDPAKSKK